jgi:dTDP-4-amino-4,6-dideoxygalactose transaminase
MIPIFNLTRQYGNIKSEIDRAIARVLQKGMFTLGAEVKLFENDFADYLGIWHAVGVGSGTDALTLTIKALDIQPGEEVIIPANSYPTVFGIALTHVKIKLVDCDENGNISLTDLEKKVTQKTKAIVAVHLYGNPADILGIRIILKNKKSSAFIIEDCAQAHGAMLKNGGWKKVGRLGDIAIYSFYPSKNLGAYGDGGMIVTDRSNVDKKLRALRMYGETSRYTSEMVSGVSRLDELQAAILTVKLQYLDRWNKDRAELAAFYTSVLTGVGDLKIVRETIGKSAHHLFVIRTSQRNELQKYLTDHEIGCAIHYPVPIHLTKSFQYLGYKKGDFPMAELLSDEVLSIPLFPELTHSEAELVVDTIKEFYKK